MGAEVQVLLQSIRSKEKLVWAPSSRGGSWYKEGVELTRGSRLHSTASEKEIFKYF